ncbi:hypothetical protein GGR50DRAFT_463986 [Xylaria sp. CBS 124048]|nr:hypothetical protein GGR50DRAFT_463986 [Xylaria sp. CBS 124048]
MELLSVRLSSFRHFDNPISGLREWSDRVAVQGDIFRLMYPVHDSLLSTFRGNSPDDQLSLLRRCQHVGSIRRTVWVPHSASPIVRLAELSRSTHRSKTRYPCCLISHDIKVSLPEALPQSDEALTGEDMPSSSSLTARRVPSSSSPPPPLYLSAWPLAPCCRRHTSTAALFSFPALRRLYAVVACLSPLGTLVSRWLTHDATRSWRYLSMPCHAIHTIPYQIDTTYKSWYLLRGTLYLFAPTRVKCL